MKFIIVVLDSLGIGELPDAERFNDKGTNTLLHIQERHELDIPNLRGLGLGNIEGLESGGLAVAEPVGFFGRLAEISEGKDTITGHWEIAGIETKQAFRTFHDGFPKEIMDEFVRQTGRGYIGNLAASGTEIIEELGEEHERSGKLIVYTSTDSVFQVAANVDVVPLEELYSICEKARKIFVNENTIGRVIARPYVIDAEGKRVRTSDRRDYAVSPPESTALNILAEEGQEVYAIGKISDIFNGSGVTRSVHTVDNDDGVMKTVEAIAENFDGLIFTNLVDFDSKYGHRNDIEGYAKAIEDFDKRLPEIITAMGSDDLLLLCSDHGNDPSDESYDHSREYIFCLGYGHKIKNGVNLGTRATFADIGATALDFLTNGKRSTAIGSSFRSEITR